MESFRRRLRRAWLLHGWIICALLLPPTGRLARADEEDIFTQTGTESSVSVNVWAPEGATGMLPGTSRQVNINVQLNTWEVWTGSQSGTIELRNPQSAPLMTGLAFNASGDGSVPASGTTDADGNATATFTMGVGASVVSVVAVGYGATGSVNFDAPVVETWAWDHDESLLSAALSTSGSTDSVPNGENRQIQVHADYSTWSVFVSNFGGVRTEYYSTSPAIGAQISWSVASGDGWVDQSSATDESGNATVNFSMGSGESVVRADVTYASSSTTYATMRFTPPFNTQEWYFDRVESVISLFAMGADGNADGLAPGEQRTVTATATASWYEVWVSNMAGIEHRNETTIPAEGMAVTFSFDGGDGQLSNSYATTDSNGHAEVIFTMGHSASRLIASVEGDLTASIDFSPVGEVWNYQTTVSALSFGGWSADGPLGDLYPGDVRLLTTAVVNTTWDLWVSNLGGSDYRLVGTSPASGVPVAFAVEFGDGQISASTSATDSVGLASVGFTMGTESATVRASLAGDIGTTVTLTAHEPQWTFDRMETTISTTLVPNGSATSVPSGAVRELTAQVRYNTWEVWRNEAGEEQRRNEATGAASGAMIDMAMAEGDGSITNAGTVTDANGLATATFTMGAGASKVRADVSYATATSLGSVDFTPGPWLFHHSESAVIVGLGADTSNVTASVSIRTWDVYTNGVDYQNQNVQNQNVSDFPAGNAQVTFSAGGSVTIAAGPVDTNIAGDASMGYSVSPQGTGTITATASFLGLTGSATIQVTSQSQPQPQPQPQTQPQPDPQPQSQPQPQPQPQPQTQPQPQPQPQPDDVPPSPQYPSVWVFGHAPGKASEPGPSISGQFVVLRPNDDNDDGVTTAPGQPEHRDSDDLEINPEDDDIVQVHLGFDKGTLTNTAVSGTVTVNFPSSGFHHFTSAAGGSSTLLSGSYTLNINSPSGPLAGMITNNGVEIYVESVPGADGATSGDITVTSNLTLADNGEPDSRTANPTAKITLLPFELNSDLNNDGKAGEGADSSLKTAGIEDTAGDDAKEKGTEYLFVNDYLSNGLFDKDDTSATKPPASHTDDDDLTELKTICAATWGAVWFEYEGGDISKLAFYKSKECTAANKVTFPFALSESNKLPEKLWVRAEPDSAWTAQVEGKLVMKFGKADKSETYASDKLRFTVVKHIGDTKFFHATRDYILENNTRFWAGEKKYGSTKPVRIVVMREEATRMTALDTYWRTPKLLGVDEVIANAPGSSASLIINANFVFDRQWEGIRRITRRCHGRIISGGVYNANVSSDNVDPNSPAPGHELRGSVLAGPDAKYIAMAATGGFGMGKGRVPLDESTNPPRAYPGWAEAMGGWHTDYSNVNRNQMVGIAKVGEQKRVVFTAMDLGSDGNTTSSFSADAKASGVPALPGGDGDDLMLLVGDADMSRAIAYRNPQDTLTVIYKDWRHVPALQGTPHYAINTYLLFTCEKPRP